jgi:hypothetical protein
MPPECGVAVYVKGVLVSVSFLPVPWILLDLISAQHSDDDHTVVP